MHTTLRLFCAVTLAFALASCGGPVHRLNPPSASIQQLRVLADGRWLLQVRFENFNQMMTHYAAVKAKFELGGVAAGEIAQTLDLDIPGGNADVAEATLQPGADASKALAEDVKNVNGAPYQLKGTISVSDRADSGSKRDFPFEHKSRLSPVPGLTNVYR